MTDFVQLGTRSESGVRVHLKNSKEQERRKRNLDGTAVATTCTASDVAVFVGMNVRVEGATLIDVSADSASGTVGEIHPAVGVSGSGSAPLPVPTVEMMVS